MLFFYNSLDQVHKIELLNSYYDHFFTKLFASCPSSVDLLIHSDFLPIYDAHPDTIKKKLDDIHRIYLLLSDDEKAKMKQAFERNRKIQDICNGTVSPIKYGELDSTISQVLKSLYNESWTLLTNSNDRQNINIKDICGNIYDHYASLFKNRRQIFTICPICGLEELLGEYESCGEHDVRAREAYDHYLPKSLYPFISINFSNLIPICHHCNSDYKNTCDPAYDNGIQQKLYYPFSNDSTNNPNDIEIKINITNIDDSQDLHKRDDWEIGLYSTNNSQEISSWDRVFKIKSRYKSKIKTKEFSWKKRLITKVKEFVRKGSMSGFKEELYKDIDITNQPSAIVQKAYYDYFFGNLLDTYLEEIN